MTSRERAKRVMLKMTSDFGDIMWGDAAEILIGRAIDAAIRSDRRRHSDAAVAAFRSAPPPDLRPVYDGTGRLIKLLLAGEVVE